MRIMIMFYIHFNSHILHHINNGVKKAFKAFAQAPQIIFLITLLWETFFPLVRISRVAFVHSIKTINYYKYSPSCFLPSRLLFSQQDLVLLYVAKAG